MLLPISRLEHMKRNSRRNKTRVMQAAKPDRSIRAWYANQMVDYIGQMELYYKQVFIENFRLREGLTLDSEDHIVNDGLASEFGRLMSIMKDTLRVTYGRAAELAGTFINRVDNNIKVKTAKKYGKAVDIQDVPMMQTSKINDIIEASVQRNVALIQDIPEKVLYQIEQVITSGMTSGASIDSMTDEIAEKFDIARRRAKNIAKDQASKVNANLNQARQESLGIRAYNWHTEEDDKVRKSHTHRNNKAYAWDKKDIGKKLADGRIILDPWVDDIGHPGHDYGCRCGAEGIVEFT